MLKNILNKLTYKDNLTFISCFFKTASLPDKQKRTTNKTKKYEKIIKLAQIFEE